jgi:hypothetical protein
MNIANVNVFNLWINVVSILYCFRNVEIHNRKLHVITRNTFGVTFVCFGVTFVFFGVTFVCFGVTFLNDCLNEKNSVMVMQIQADGIVCLISL